MGRNYISFVILIVLVLYHQGQGKAQEDDDEAALTTFRAKMNQDLINLRTLEEKDSCHPSEEQRVAFLKVNSESDASHLPTLEKQWSDFMQTKRDTVKLCKEGLRCDQSKGSCVKDDGEFEDVTEVPAPVKKFKGKPVVVTVPATASSPSSVEVKPTEILTSGILSSSESGPASERKGDEEPFKADESDRAEADVNHPIQGRALNGEDANQNVGESGSEARLGRNADAVNGSATTTVSHAGMVTGGNDTPKNPNNNASTGTEEYHDNPGGTRPAKQSGMMHLQSVFTVFLTCTLVFLTSSAF